MYNNLSIREAAKIMGVTNKTLRLWEVNGKIKSVRTPGGHRRYDLSDLLKGKNDTNLTFCYARVSTNEQKEDLKRQVQVLEAYCASHGWSHEIIQDLGSGMNYNKKGLKRLIKLICTGKVERLVLSHKDRLLRFGSDLVFMLCEQFGTEVIIINRTEDSTFEEDLTNDVLEIITVFSARLYGSRSHKNKQIVDKLKEAADKI
jgi:putative resolvase